MRPAGPGSNPWEVSIQILPASFAEVMQRSFCDIQEHARAASSASERRRTEAGDRGPLGHRPAHGYALAGAELPGSQAGPLPAVIQ
jgi:hypothetical protein